MCDLMYCCNYGSVFNKPSFSDFPKCRVMRRFVVREGMCACWSIMCLSPIIIRSLPLFNRDNENESQSWAPLSSLRLSGHPPLSSDSGSGSGSGSYDFPESSSNSNLSVPLMYSISAVIPFLLDMELFISLRLPPFRRSVCLSWACTAHSSMKCLTVSLAAPHAGQDGLSIFPIRWR
jgi:hypothetical protein